MLFRTLGSFVVGSILVAACLGDDPVGADRPGGDADSGVGSSSSSGGTGSGDATPGQPWSVTVAGPVSVVRGKSVAIALTVTGTVTAPLTVQVQNAAGFSGSTTLSASATTGTLDVQVDAARPFGAATVPLSVTDGVHTSTLEAAVEVRDAPGALDSTFGQGGSIVVPRSRGRWFFPGGSPASLHWMGEDTGTADVTTVVRRYAADGTLDASYGSSGAITWPWTGDRSQDMRELFGSPLARVSATGGLELLTGYVSDSGFFVHVRQVPANGQGEVSLLAGSETSPVDMLSNYYRAYHEPDALTRLADGRIVTVTRETTPVPRLVGTVWKNGIADTSWPEGGKQAIAMGSIPDAALQSILVTGTHIFVGGHSTSPAGGVVYAFALSGAGWKESQQIVGTPDGFSHLTETSDGKVHVLVGQGRPGDAVNLSVATLKTETIGSGNEAIVDKGALNYGIVEPGVLTAGLAGSTIWCRRDPAAPQTILVLAANALNQPLGEFASGGELKLDMSAVVPAFPLASNEPVPLALTGPDGRLYVQIDGASSSRLYRIWL